MAEGSYPGILLGRRVADPSAADAWHHALVREGDDREVVRARLVWR